MEAIWTNFTQKNNEYIFSGLQNWWEAGDWVRKQAERKWIQGNGFHPWLECDLVLLPWLVNPGATSKTGRRAGIAIDTLVSENQRLLAFQPHSLRFTASIAQIVSPEDLWFVVQAKVHVSMTYLAEERIHKEYSI